MEAVEQHLKSGKFKDLSIPEDVVLPTSSTVEMPQITDTHLGETIDIKTNTFNMEIASKKMQKYGRMDQEVPP